MALNLFKDNVPSIQDPANQIWKQINSAVFRW